jgi:hypothetical protein
MRRATAIVLAILLATAVAGPASADGGGHGAGKGFVQPNAKVHGYSLEQLAIAWNTYAFGTPAPENPLLTNRCEPSPTDPRIWFVPVSIGGDYEVDCQVPTGAFLVATPAGYFCEPIEAGGSSTAALLACATNGFATLTFVQVVLDGRQAKHLDRYVVTTPRIELAGPNLLSEDATPIIDKGIYVVVKPLRPGSHTLRLYDEFGSLAFGVTVNLTVTSRR